MSEKFGMDKELAGKLEVSIDPILEVADPVAELQELIDSALSLSSPFNIAHAATATDVTVYPPPGPPSEEPESKKRKLNAEGSVNGTASSGITSVNDTQHARLPNLMLANKHIETVYSILKKECEQLADVCDKRFHVLSSIPIHRIEDGDNFGVQIQEEVLTELHRSQESAYNLRDACRQAHLGRAKICSKIIKYPHVEDYTLALKEHDEKQLYVARQNLLDLRNVYAILTDLLHKNMTKIRSPKGNNHSSLY
ncbi:uncharacterized protein FIBRA_00070 [Fibroporia radiculosa]|uniref:Proteasome activator PA28 C-terminal domain-containing protein n=1 Tax=Fibroporia radiculosa TaxID=599839 RepID=J7SBS3_9APHY|nr:uncharacterized protein FIBRA_00070 [Fibroporia radiculosa]CCL98076.1 predicted protein [Fibroporia radiculosa]